MDTAARWRSGIHANASRLLGLTDRALAQVRMANCTVRSDSQWVSLLALSRSEGIEVEAALATRFFSCLPETVNRVETHVSHRKQTTEPLSTRNVPAHAFCPIPGGFFDGLA